ncbi:MAG: MFS transporter [Candidatus Lokiarchaeota archaeon]|nr:MFS transporter [Candidatus Lokiarchaeota archaeon]MBD3338249.1 MFS transporter [Candidatus Lokiarchaeota archaeon]
MEKNELDGLVKQKEVYGHSKSIMASYGARELFGQWVGAAFGFTTFFFYEAVIGLSVVLGALAFVLYSIWNAINDPLVGYIMERIHPFWEKKWKLKRFPWIVIGVIPWLISFFLVFMVPLEWDPVQDPSYNWPVFGYYLFSICLYDTTLTIYDVNVVSLYPDKFRGLNERRTATGFGTLLGMIGLVLAAIVPPMFITTGVAETYRIAALVTVSVGLVLFIFIIPGVWEDKKTRTLYETRLKSDEEEKNLSSFFETSRMAIKDRVFMAKALFFFGYQVGAVMLQTSAFYVVTYLLDEEAGAITFLLGSMLLGAIISVPIWMILARKVNDNRKMSIAAGIMMVLTFLPMIFVSTLLGWIIVMLLFGIGLGGQWYMDPPTMGDTLDDIAVRTGKRQQAIYYGFQAFFIRLGQTSIAITIAVVHILTGFVEGAPSLSELRARSPTPELALFGIRIHSAIVPAIIVLLTIFIFWKFYNLTPDKVAENRKKLEELRL